MNSAHPIDVLNRLYALHNMSLAMYLRFATPWVRDPAALNGQADSLDVLRRIAQDQTALRDRCGELILESDGVVRRGTFPLSFTSLHDLSFDFLLGKLIVDQKRLIGEFERCSAQLEYEPLAKALAEESIGFARGHLDMLEDLKNPKIGLKLAEESATSEDVSPGTIVGAPADPAAPAATHAPIHH
jgi:hypothetical protein